MSQAGATATTRRDDEIDPELIALKRPIAGVGPLVLASVLALSAFLCWKLRHDLAYALSDGAPRDLGRAADVWRSARAFPDNAYVVVEALPDRTWPVRLRGRQDVGHRLLPAIGTEGHLWIAVAGEAFTAAPAHDERYTGRVRRLTDLEFADELRAFLRAAPPLPRFVDLATWGRGPDGVVRDLGGDTIPASADTPVEIDERIDGVALVTLLATDTLADAAAARRALVAAGLVPDPGLEPVATTDASFTFEVPAPAGLSEVRRALAEAKLWNAHAVAKTVRHTARWGDLAADAGTIRVAGRTVSLGAVERVALLVRPTLPDHAYVLFEGDAPGTFWYVPVVVGLLLAVSLLTIVAFVRRFRRRPA